MLIKKDGVKRKEERKLNEAKKAEKKLDPEPRRKRKREEKKRIGTGVLRVELVGFSFTLGVGTE